MAPAASCYRGWKKRNLFGSLCFGKKKLLFDTYISTTDDPIELKVKLLIETDATIRFA